MTTFSGQPGGSLAHFMGKKILISGHTGFKGSWLMLWLQSLGAEVIGIGLDPSTSPSLFEIVGKDLKIKDTRIDIRNTEMVKQLIEAEQPDFVFHLAAQSLVRESYENATYTWETNLLGTVNVLEGLKLLKKKCTAIFVTSDKCYKNVEWLWGYREIDTLGGDDPYSASKAAAEIAIHSYVNSFFNSKGSHVRISTGRAGNVIGGGDWSENRVIPDSVKSWAKNEPAKLRNPKSTRPWQHVLEPLSGYMSLAIQLSLDEKLHGESFNFGPNAQVERTVMDLVSAMSDHWHDVKWEVESNLDGGMSEANLLRLNCDKAANLLSWKPTLMFEETVQLTADWYRTFYSSPAQIPALCFSQIEKYTDLAQARDVAWANS
jgi:CDP-glucose 4,6-dehydratase